MRQDFQHFQQRLKHFFHITNKTSETRKKKDKGLQLSLVKNLWQFSIIDITKLLNCLQTLHDQYTMTITINTDLFVQHPIQISDKM